MHLFAFRKLKRSILEKEKMNRKLQKLAHTDDLTGLYNYRFLIKHLENELKKCKKSNRLLSVLMLDIDHFKKVNDKYGHPLGDKLLREVGQIIKKNARGIDTVTRYGGEEFCIVLLDTNIRLACDIAERIRNAIENHPLKYKDIQFDDKLTVSIGVANFPEHCENSNELIMMADQALYKAKLRRNDVELFQPDMMNNNRQNNMIAG